MKLDFKKPPLTYQEQVARLEARGMAVADRSEAAFYLSHLNYYRLAGYWLPFEMDHATHRFRPGTSFRDVLNLYFFDRELRSRERSSKQTRSPKAEDVLAADNEVVDDTEAHGFRG